MKVCVRCGELKDSALFYKCKARKDGLGSYCKSCHDIKSAGTKYNYELKRRDVLRKKYGMTLESYEALLIAQDSKCAICKLDVKDHRRALNVDHCHETGRVRGLLCDDCNIALGKFKDDISSLLRAAEYLATSRKGA